MIERQIIFMSETDHIFFFPRRIFLFFVKLKFFLHFFTHVEKIQEIGKNFLR